MTTTTHTCDRCKKSEVLQPYQPSTLDLKRVGVGCETINNFGLDKLVSLRFQQDWCAKCRNEIGLEWKDSAAEATKPSPTVEEQLVEALRVFVENNTPQP